MPSFPSLLALFFASLLAGQYLSGPNYSPPPSRKNRKNSKAPLNRVHPRLPSPSFTDFQRLFLSSPRSFFVSLPRSFAPVCVYVCSVLPSASRGMSPPTSLSPLAPPSSSLLPTGKRFRATRHPGNRAKPVISKRKKKVFLGYRPFPPFEPLLRVVSLPSSTPLCSPLLRARGEKGETREEENDSFIPWLAILPRETMLLCRP